MAKALQAQGFERTDWTYQKGTGAEATADRKEFSLVCNITAKIAWRADTDGRITSIHGSYGGSCL